MFVDEIIVERKYTDEEREAVNTYVTNCLMANIADSKRIKKMVKKPDAPNVGGMLEIYQWRDGTTFHAKVLDEVYYDDERDCFAVDVATDTGEATWDEKNNRWEDGEY